MALSQYLMHAPSWPCHHGHADYAQSVTHLRARVMTEVDRPLVPLHLDCTVCPLLSPFATF